MRFIAIASLLVGCASVDTDTQQPVPPLVSFMSTDVGPFVLGRTGTIRAMNGPTGERAYLAYSPNGAGNGPCPPSWGGACAGLLAPVSAIANRVVDNAGEVQFDLPLPNALPFSEAWLQVAVPGSPVYLSDALQIQILEQDGDEDGDGATNVVEYDAGTDPYTPDSDGGGATDGAELLCGTDPLDGSDDANCTGPGNLIVDLTVTFDPNAAGDSLCPVSGICDCSSSFQGTGIFDNDAGGDLQFLGTWELVTSNCNAVTGFPQGVWTPAVGVPAWHTMAMNGSTLVSWTTHEDQANGVPQPAGAPGQFWIDPINQSWTPGVQISHSETDTLSVVFGIEIDITYDLAITF